MATEKKRWTLHEVATEIDKTNRMRPRSDVRGNGSKEFEAQYNKMRKMIEKYDKENGNNKANVKAKKK